MLWDLPEMVTDVTDRGEGTCWIKAKIVLFVSLQSLDCSLYMSFGRISCRIYLINSFKR